MADVDTGKVADEVARLEEELAAKKLELEAAQRKANFQEFPKYLMDPDDSSKGVTVQSAEEEEKVLADRAKKSKAPVAPVPVPVTIVPEGTPKAVPPLAPPPPAPTADDQDDTPEPARRKGGR